MLKIDRKVDVDADGDGEQDWMDVFTKTCVRRKVNLNDPQKRG